MRKVIEKIQADKIIYFCFLAGSILIVLSFALIGIFYSKLPPILPVFNQLPWGEARLGAKQQVFIPTGVALGFYLVNTTISYRMYDKIPLLSRIIMVTTLLFCLL